VRTLLLLLPFSIFYSCERFAVNDSSGLVTWSGAYPAVILHAGENPLWFLLTEDGPKHIDSIDDISHTFALIPWPYAPFIRFLHEENDSVIMTVNRDGFLKLAPYGGKEKGIALYRFSGGDFWRQYMVGGFVFYNEQPAAVLYLDDVFLSSDLPQPNPRVWSFNMNSNIPFPVSIPALEFFPEEEGWNVDSLRIADNGLYYYRAAKRSGSSPVVRMFRSADLSAEGVEISVDVFFNSIPRETAVSDPALPLLPEGFVYTGIGKVGGSLFASWEEQEDFSIGAAGFVLIKP